MRASRGADRRAARVEFLMPQGSGAARWARRLTRGFLAGRAGEGVTDAELVVSELVANAIEAQSGSCRMSLCLHSGELTVAVHDDAPGGPRLMPDSRTAESGRGIALVQALARRWSVRPDPRGGKTVLAVLAPC
ncbi:ATP-binding protein [Streptomyces endophyticus]|uniref:ATP-binding protein n=1 Tax=Streptomyces endophyticus TaxID=714166 RepID=A0ABU6FFQ0_9ACTN|nr:ATP-binding protein [Streptomyces endophyticus]MEB8342876.1 ATP-binding protein [Streptomyces endophyticus]